MGSLRRTLRGHLRGNILGIFVFYHHDRAGVLLLLKLGLGLGL